MLSPTKKASGFWLLGPLFLLFVTSCSSTIPIPDPQVETAAPSPTDTTTPIQDASSEPVIKKEGLQEVDFASTFPDHRAADFLTRSFTESVDQRVLLYLAAAKRFIQSGDYESASVVLDSIGSASGGPWASVQHQLLQAAVAVGVGRPNRALTILSNIDDPLENPKQATLWYRLQLRTLFARGDIKDALDVVDRASSTTTDAALKQELAQAIYRALSRLPDDQLTEAAQAFALADHQLAWFTLTYILGHDGWQAERLKQALDLWIKANPEHPGHILAAQRASDSCVLEAEDSVALILPLSSIYEAAANAFKNGFLSRYGQSSAETSVSIFDFGDQAERAVAQYDSAAAGGARLIVGPVGREGVDALVARKRLPVPTLLIGRDSVAPRQNAFWIDISREAEALDLVAHARTRNLSHALFLSSTDPAARHLAQQAASAWSDLGGDIAGSATIPSNTADYSQLLTRVLGLNASEKQVLDIKAFLGGGITIETDVAVRQDLDAIFIFAEPDTVRLLKPQLNFHKAGSIDVFAQNLIFDGSPDPVNDLDLEGISFADMPWMIRNGSEFAKQAITATYGQPYTQTALGRFFALGADAHAIGCRLLNRPTDESWSFDGPSGRLSKRERNEIHRESEWAQFEEGLIKIFDPPIAPER
ncbi:MAG: penicillin-binding protein activator [Arenicellales bacterium]